MCCNDQCKKPTPLPAPPISTRAYRPAYPLHFCCLFCVDRLLFLGRPLGGRRGSERHFVVSTSNSALCLALPLDKRLCSDGWHALEKRLELVTAHQIDLQEKKIAVKKRHLEEGKKSDGHPKRPVDCCTPRPQADSRRILWAAAPVQSPI